METEIIGKIQAQGAAYVQQEWTQTLKRERKTVSKDGNDLQIEDGRVEPGRNGKHQDKYGQDGCYVGYHQHQHKDGIAVIT